MGRITSFEGLGCLVTGASSGIGWEIARLLAAEGARLVVTARRGPRLEELARVCHEDGAAACHVVVADLGQRGSVPDLVARAREHLGDVDVLINNAGFAVPGPFVRSDLERTLAMIEVNISSATALMRTLLPGMLQRDRGGVLNVASIAGFQAAPYQAAYAGSKSYLLNLSESVHQEVKHTNVAVTALCPGVTDTEFFDAAGYKNLGKLMERRMPADRVARVGLRGLRRGKMTVVPGGLNRTMIALERVFPRVFVADVARRVMGGRTARRGGP